MKESNKIGGEKDQDMISGVVGNIGDSLKFGAKLLKDTVGKAVPINALE